MITALNIEHHNQKGLCRAFSLLRRNRIRVEHMYCDTAAVKSVTYEHNRGRVSWDTLGRFIKHERSRLLCSEEIELPADCGYKRYVSYELNRRLCENAALHMLHMIAPLSPAVALIDNSGESLPLCRYLAEYTDRLSVVTAQPELYLDEADTLLCDKGAVMRVSTGYGAVCSADIVIAPDMLTEDIRCSPDAIVLSSRCPQHSQNAPVIYEYTFTLPDKYRRIKPGHLDDMYFASALYTLGGAHELGSSVFTRCYDGSVLHTDKSLMMLLSDRMSEKSPHK